MKSKILTVVLTTAVLLGLLLVPAMSMSVPTVVGNGLDVGIEIHPSVAKVGFNTAFTADIVINNSASHAINAYVFNLTFPSALVTVEGVTVNTSVFSIGGDPDWSNTSGWVVLGKGKSGNTTLSSINVATISFKSKSSSGIAALNFLPDPDTAVYDADTSSNVIDPARVVNATVKVGKANLVIAVSNGTTMDVSFPNTTNVNRYTTLVAADIVNNTATALAQFCPAANRTALTIPVKLLYAYVTVNMSNYETLQQVAYMLSDLAGNGTYTLGSPVVQDYVYDPGHGNYSAVGNNWSYNVTMTIPDLPPYPLTATAQRWVVVTSQSAPVAVSSCGVPLGTVYCIHLVHSDAAPVDGNVTGNVTYEQWIANPYLPGPLNGTGLVQIKDYATFTEDAAHGYAKATETSVLSGIHPAAVASASKVEIAGTGQVAPPYPNVTQWDWDAVKTLTATSQVPGWYFSHWTGDLYCTGNSITMDKDKAVFPNYCQYPPILTNTGNTSLSFVCRCGGADPANQTLSIKNTGGYVVNWNASSDAGWLTVVPPTSGSLSAGVSATITVHATCAGSPGVYNGNVTITGSSSIVIPVTLTVQEATTIDVCRVLPANATTTNATYPGMSFNVTVSWTAPVDEFNSIGLTDVAPDGWTVQADNSWCTPEASFNTSHGNKVEYLWADSYNITTSFVATYRVTVPVTATPGINTWEVCANMTKAWLEYYYGRNESYSSCIGCDYQMVVTVPGYATGETRDVNTKLLPDTLVTLERSASPVDTDESTPDYSIKCWNTGGDYWLLATKNRYDPLSTVVVGGIAPHNINLTPNIDWSTPYLLSQGAVIDFEGDYGLVPMACDMSYALRSVNLWLFWPTSNPEWGLTVWKAMQSVDSWQNPS